MELRGEDNEPNTKLIRSPVRLMNDSIQRLGLAAQIDIAVKRGGIHNMMW
jgi:hypothetical protein